MRPEGVQGLVRDQRVRHGVCKRVSLPFGLSRGEASIAQLLRVLKRIQRERHPSVLAAQVGPPNGRGNKRAWFDLYVERIVTPLIPGDPYTWVYATRGEPGTCRSPASPRSWSTFS